MSSTSEVGHAKNVANFNDLFVFATGYGLAYNPTKTALKLPALNTLLTNAQADLFNVLNKNVLYNNAVNARQITFSNLRTLSTRIMSALKATDATKELIRDAQAYNLKLQGKRAKALPAVDPNTPAPVNNSVSQGSYDQLIQHFTGLIAVITSEPTYSPSELELKITTLNTKLADMIAKNNAVSIAYTAISNARMARNKTLYKPLVGLVDIAIAVKIYIQSIFGANSPENKQIKKIAFKTQSL